VVWCFCPLSLNKFIHRCLGGCQTRFFRSRLGRIASLPLIKDLEKLDRLQPHWQPWHDLYKASPDDARLWHHGWLLEEFRIALFAPDVPTAFKVSEKILEVSFEKI